MANTGNITMKDIAKSLGVSITTVSKVVNGHSDISEKTRQEVMGKIAEMGYVPNMLAMNLRRSRANMVALVLSDLSKPYYGQVIEGYERVLEAAGYQSITFSSMENRDREDRFIRRVASMNMAGIIIDPAQNSDPEQTALKHAGIPYVFSNRVPEGNSGYYVAADNDLAGYIATGHLLKKKSGAPVFCVNGPSHISPTVARFRGYQKALAEAKMPFNPDYVFENCFGLEEAYAIGKKIARMVKPPFSVFCATDQFAVGIVRALHDSGLRIPGDVGVIGVDDIDMAQYMVPSLTTVALPKSRIGEASAKMLIDLIEGREVENSAILLKPELIVRETT